MKKLFTFKEIDSGDMLEQFFRLRYEVYADCENKVFITENPAQLDIDSFDIHAKHYGFMCDNNLVGYFRMVFPQGEFRNEQVIEIANRHLLQKQINPVANNAPFPFLSYDGVPKVHWDYYENLLKKSERMVEISRLILHPAYREMKMSRLLIDFGCTIYILLCDKIRSVLVNCSQSHEVFYKYYGFQSIDNLGGYSVGKLRKVSLVFSTLTHKPPYEKVDSMVQEFKLNNKIQLEL